MGEIGSQYDSEYKPVPNCPVPDYLLGKVDTHLKQNGDGVCVRDISTGGTLLYSELEPMSRRVSSGLTRRGFESRDTMVYVTSNCCKIYPILLGVWRVNGIIRPSYPADTEETLLKRMVESECRFVLCDASTAPSVTSVCRQLEWKVVVFCFDQLDGCVHVDSLYQDDGTAFPEKVSIDPEDILAVLCTGGTTGPSKGATVTHRRLLTFLAMEKWVFPKVTNKRVLLTIRIFHMGGSVLGAIMMTRGVEILLMSDCTPDIFFRGIHEHKPSVLFGFSTTLLWANSCPKTYDLSSVRCILTAGSPFTDAINMSLKKAYPSLTQLHQAYGLTEAFFITCTVNPMASGDEESMKYEGTPELSSGLVVPGVKIKIVCTETGETLGANQNGVILVKGPMNMANYYKNPQADAKTYRDGWLVTGDYGYYDTKGFLFCLDRISESFKYWSYHISPVELEDVIMSHPDVVEACVIGIPDPDGGDRIPRAFIKKTESSTSLDQQAIMEFVHARVASYMQLRGGVAFLEDIPRSVAGKMSRQHIRNLYQSGAL